MEVKWEKKIMNASISISNSSVLYLGIMIFEVYAGERCDVNLNGESTMIYCPYYMIYKKRKI